METTLIVVVGVLANAMVISVLIANVRIARGDRRRADLLEKLIQRVLAAGDLREFLVSPAAEHLFQAPTRAAEPYTRVIRSVQIGIVLGLVGATTLLLSALQPVARLSLLISGALVTALGVGFLGAAGVAYLLSKRWGLLDAAQQGSLPATQAPRARTAAP